MERESDRGDPVALSSLNTKDVVPFRRDDATSRLVFSKKTEKSGDGSAVVDACPLGVFMPLGFCLLLVCLDVRSRLVKKENDLLRYV